MRWAEIITKTKEVVMRKLINVSNIPSTEWEEEQKAGWDEIADIQFQVDPKASVWEVEEQARNLFKEILKRGLEDKSIRVTIYGELTLCYILIDLIRRWNGTSINPEIQIFVPVFERKEVEGVQPDGSLKKITISKFVQWREI
jgi:hypothetical protein